MIDEGVIQDDLLKEETIDLDRMTEEIEKLRSIRGTTELKGFRALKDWLKPVGKVVRPSFGGKIEVEKQALFDDGQDQFKCGR